MNPITDILFKKALPIVLKHEGGWNDVEGDNGGETFKGIARNFWGKWEGWKIVDSFKDLDNFEEVVNNDKELAVLVEEFYYKHFWKPLKLDRVISPSLAIALFDKGINMSIRQVVKLLQKSLNVIGAKLTVDGSLGNKTIKQINKYNVYKGLVLATFKGELYVFYKGLAERKPKMKKFLKGWIRRI